MAVDDYPQKDFNAGVQGAVGIQLFFDLSGKPYRCAIYASSGSQSLDAASCVPKLKRARVKSALDGSGVPIYSAISMRNMWVNPNAWAKKPENEDAPRRIFRVDDAGDDFKSGSTITLLVENDGKVSGCRPSQSAINKQLAELACKYMLQSTMQPITNEKDEAVCAVVTWPVTFTGQKDLHAPKEGEVFDN